MLPGVVPPEGGFEPFTERSKRVVQIAGTRTPLGIGITQCNDKSIAEKGLTGKGLMMTHFYTDYLWRLGSKIHPKLDLVDRIDSDAEIDDDAAAEAEEEQNRSAPASGVPSSSTDPAPEQTVVSETQSSEKVVEQQVHVVERTAPASEAEGEAASDMENIPAEIMDALILATFLQALKRRVKDADLPMLVSAFYSQIFLPCRPVGTNINLKRSSYKKFGAFLERQAESGLVILDEPSPGVDRIISVNRAHELLVNFRLLPLAATVEGAERAAEAEAEASEEATGPQIREAWQVPRNLHAVVPEDISYV